MQGTRSDAFLFYLFSHSYTQSLNYVAHLWRELELYRSHHYLTLTFGTSRIWIDSEAFLYSTSRTRPIVLLYFTVFAYTPLETSDFSMLIIPVIQRNDTKNVSRRVSTHSSTRCANNKTRISVKKNREKSFIRSYLFELTLEIGLPKSNSNKSVHLGVHLPSAHEPFCSLL